MEFDIDFIAHNNKLSEYNPFVKVFVSLILILSTLVMSNNYYSIAIIILSSILVLGVARVSLKDYIKFLIIPFSFTFLTCIFILFFFPQGEYIWDSGIWGIGITTYSYTTSMLTFFRVFGCFSSLGFMTLTTPIADVMHVLRRCYVPQLGYLSTSTDTIKSLGGMGSNLFLTSLEKSETLQKSLDSRCYTGDLPVYRPDRKKESYPELVN